MAPVEVEVRSFVSPAQYKRLAQLFSEKCGKSRAERQVTHYFDCPQDLRIQKSARFAKLWLKSGKIHDDHREEIEVKFPKEDFEKLESLLVQLGFNVQIKWFRTRRRYQWNGIKVCIDHTAGYGHIIELEKMADESDKKKAHELLRKELARLGVDETPRELFEKKFRYYKANWRKLVEKERPAGF